MTKKTKILAGILATVLLVGATTTVLCLGRDKEPASQGQVSVQPNDSADCVTDETGKELTAGVNVMPTRMTFRNARALTNASEYDSVTIQASIKPDNATNKNVSWSVSFVNPASKWATGKAVTDYVTVTPQSTGSNIATVECLKPFGEQIKITVTSESNRNAKAECTVDFAKRINQVLYDIRCEDKDYYKDENDFSADAVYLDVGLDWDLWLDSPNCIYTDYTVNDVFEETFEIYSNEDVIEQFTSETGFFPVTAALELDKSEDAIYGPLSYTLDGVDWSNPEYFNVLNNWFKVNTDKAMFTIHYKAVGQYSTWEAEVPIYVNVDQLSVLVTEITLNQSNMIF